MSCNWQTASQPQYKNALLLICNTLVVKSSKRHSTPRLVISSYRTLVSVFVIILWIYSFCMNNPNFIYSCICIYRIIGYIMCIFNIRWLHNLMSRKNSCNIQLTNYSWQWYRKDQQLFTPQNDCSRATITNQ